MRTDDQTPGLSSQDGAKARREQIGPYEVGPPVPVTSSFGQQDARGPVRYLQAFRAHWLLIVLTCAISVSIAAFVSYTATKQYDASADLQVQALPAYGGDPFQGLSLFRQTVDGASPVVAAARVLGSDIYQQPTFKALGARGKGVSIGVTPLSQADILALTASAPSPQQAADAANTYARTVIQLRGQLFQRELQQKIDQVQRQIAAIPESARATNATYQSLAGTLGQYQSYLKAPDPTVQILTGAQVPFAPSWPHPKTSIAIAFFIGLLLGMAIAVALELINASISREDELVLLHRLPILARIPRISSRSVHGYLVGRSLLPPDVWKGYRTLRAVLATAGSDGSYPRSILVTSASPGDGKTMTAVNLAIALAASDLRVTLIDADFHRPMVGSIFNVTGRQDGLVRFLRDPSTEEVSTTPAGTYPRLRLLLSNRGQLRELHLLETQRLERLLELLARTNDVVIIDSPPLTEVAEGLALADAAEAVVVAVRMGHTRRDRLSDLRDLLDRRGINPLGFVVTTRRRPGGGTAYDYSDDLTMPTFASSFSAKQAERSNRVAQQSRD
jgi:capsular exopolysaccharide synthesis family protein